MMIIKKLLVLFVCLVGSVALATDPIFLYLGVDDFEERPSTLSIQVTSTKTNILSSITSDIISSNGNIRKITFIPTGYGESKIIINVCDNGYVANNTDFVYGVPQLIPDPTGGSGNITVTNKGEQLTTISSNNKITLVWSPTANISGYKINRFNTNSFVENDFYTIGYNIRSASGFIPNTFIDTNVINGVKYWYSINWIPTNTGTLYKSCNSLEFNIIIQNPVPMYNTLDGIVFMASSNTMYQVFYKTNLNQLSWILYQQMELTNKQVVKIIDNSFKDKLFYIRER